MNAAHEIRRLSTLAILPTAIATLLLGSVSAFAQEDEPEPEPEKSTGIEDIYVTAERREARLQETPVAVSVFTGADLDNQGYLDFEDVSFSIPNVQFGRTLVGSGGVTIRGISSGSGDRSTAFHFDGIYINRATAAEGLTFFDIQRVEVLRGPQGTLYGRNATGGSINVISNPPGPEFEAFGDIQFGDYSQILWRGAFNIPIVSERLFARVSLFGEHRDGYQRNVAPKDRTITWDGSPTNRDDGDDAAEFGLRSQLRWLPSDTLDLTLRYVYTQQKGVGPAQKILGDFPDSVFFGGVVLTDQYCRSETPLSGSPAGCRTFVDPLNPTAAELARQVTDNPSNDRKIALDLIGDVDAWDHNVNGQLVWDLPDMSFVGATQFKVLGSYLRRRGYGLSDQDGSDGDLIRVFTTVNTVFERIGDKTDPDATPLLSTTKGCNAQKLADGDTADVAGCRPGHNKLTETTFEAQWKSSGDGNLDWVLGAFYLNSKSNTNGVATTTPIPWQLNLQFLVPPDALADLQVPVLTVATVRAKSLAAFGQVDYRFGQDSETMWDNWTPTLGLRYTYDWKKSIRKTPEVSVTLPPALGGGFFVVQGQIDNSDSERWNSAKDSLTGTARLKWDWVPSSIGDWVSEDSHAYFSVSRGYKAGFINTALADPQDSTSSFENADPEHIWAYELGLKNRFWEDRIQANFTGFYYDYQDLQVSQLANVSIVTQNASDATVWGLEAELIGKPLEGFVPELLEGLTLIGNFGYLQAEYDDFDDCYLGEANAFIDCTDNTLVRAPDHTITVIADWPLDLGRYGTLTPNAQFYASGKVQFRPTNCPNSECAAALAIAMPGREQNRDSQSAYELWNARLTWTSPDYHVSVAAFVDNIADKDIIQSQVVGSFQIGAPIQVRFDRPRTWGVRVGVSW